MKLWSYWVERCERQMDPRPLALLRILFPLCILLDLIRIAQLGLLPHLFRTYEDGGISKIQHQSLFITDWLGPNAGLYALGITAICMALIMVGVWTRPAILLGVSAYAQVGHLFPPGDRGIDRLLRTALLILLFSGAHKCWTLRKQQRPLQIPAWPADLIKFVLVLMYMSAGIAKLIQQPEWLSLTAEPPVLRIMTDPLSAHLDPVFWSQWPWLFRIGSWGTIVLEVTAPLLMTRFCRHWAALGLGLHIGIALTMELGMFAWGMLAFYPLLLEPWLTRWLDRK